MPVDDYYTWTANTYISSDITTGDTTRSTTADSTQLTVNDVNSLFGSLFDSYSVFERILRSSRRTHKFRRPRKIIGRKYFERKIEFGG